MDLASVTPGNYLPAHVYSEDLSIMQLIYPNQLSEAVTLKLFTARENPDAIRLIIV